MENNKWREVIFLVFCVMLSGAFIRSFGTKPAQNRAFGAELSPDSTPVLLSHQNPNFNIAVSTTSPSTYKPTFYPVWWEGYEKLRRICSCESWGNSDKEPRQFKEDGSLLKGYPVPSDVGACQISLVYWGKQSKEMGLDVINSYFDNIKFAKWLFDKFGDSPWSASRHCWSTSIKLENVGEI